MWKQISAVFAINSASIFNRRHNAEGGCSEALSRSSPSGIRSRLIAVGVLALLGTLAATTQAADPDPTKKGSTGTSSGSSGTQSTQTAPPAPVSKVTVPAIRSAKVEAITGTGTTTGTTTGQTTTPATTVRNQATGDLTGGQSDQKPGIDQGFRNKPGQIDAGSTVSGNPISTTGTCVGGPLGAAACSQTGPTGIAAQGKSAIQAGVLENGANVVGSGAGTTSLPPTGGTGTSGGRVVTDPFTGKPVTGSSSAHQQQLDSASCDSGDNAACARLKASQEAEASQGSGGAESEKVVRHASGNSTRYNSDGSVTHTAFNADGSYTDTTVKKESKTVDGKTTTTTTVTKATYGKDDKKTGETTVVNTVSPCPPELCGSTPESIAKFYAENPALFSQIQQSKSGGSGDIDFGRGDTAPGVVRSGTPSAVGGGSTGLVGNPGVRGGLGETGSVDTTTNFGNSQGAGAVNPGQDGNLNTTGGRTDNVDEQINGGQPKQDFPNNNTGTGSGNGTSGSTPQTPSTGPTRVQCVKGHPLPALRCPE